MKLDSSLAWRQASAAIYANRDVLLALAGVFFLLPRLAFALLAPEPVAPATGAAPEEMLRQMQAYYLKVLPMLLPTVLLETVGTLAMLALFADRRRPTVREAIGQGVRALLPYLAAQIGVAMAVAVAASVALALGGQQQAAGGLLLGVVLGGFAYVAVRLVLLAPVVAVDGVANPLAAIRRSWALTAGNAGRLAVLLALVLVALVVVMLAATSVLGAAAALALGPDGARVVSAVVESVLAAAFVVYLTGLLAAVHRQLSVQPAALF
ncbi:MAG TPA: hypothetical protein VFF94_17175 [Novosphingobium sp.]|nr:hypothetical protein [Novosphingobium sp.]